MLRKRVVWAGNNPEYQFNNTNKMVCKYIYNIMKDIQISPEYTTLWPKLGLSMLISTVSHLPCGTLPDGCSACTVTEGRIGWGIVISPSF